MLQRRPRQLGEGTGESMSLHINRPSSTRYVARVRPPGHKRYECIGRPTRSLKAAIKRMAGAFAEGSYKRGDVILTADYYEPVQIVELVRK